jgi:Na+-translocating ferredoxin:NAD+ oxidoreductase RnfC subunit
MSALPVLVQIDATYGLTVEVGDYVRRGERLGNVPGAPTACVCPVDGTVESIRFDGERHEFVISITPAS